MFNLNESMRYLLYNKPTDMRKSFHTLGGIVRNAMGCDPTNGDVYVFMNKQRNRIKLLHWERGGMVLYSKLLEEGTFPLPKNASDADQFRWNGGNSSSWWKASWRRGNAGTRDWRNSGTPMK